MSLHLKNILLKHWLLLFFVFSMIGCPPVWATVDFSAQTNLSCAACHENPHGGGTLTPTGDAFRSAGWVLPQDKGPGWWPRLGRLALGFVHVLAAFIWLGTIFYVHLFMGPRALTSGLPKGEVKLGRMSIVVVALTGVGLTLLRLRSVQELWTTTFGLVWLVKVGLFILMVGVAAAATLWVDRRLKEKGAQKGGLPDGADGGPAHLVVAGRIYDVSDSKLWKEGVHMGRHRAGRDLTEELAEAPHGAEVLDRVAAVGPLSEPAQMARATTLKIFVILANVALVAGILILFCVAYWKWGPPLTFATEVRWTTARAEACLDCHALETPGLHRDWSRSTHARMKVSCLHCHQAGPREPGLSAAHFEQYRRQKSAFRGEGRGVAVSAVVTPQDCARCHPNQAEEYARSKHAHAVEIMWRLDPWLKEGLSSEVERSVGCFACHGTILRLKNGRPTPGTWPNSGVGRLNLDGSKGSCTPCHARHRFAVAEARRAEACGRCHVGPEHSQMEIYKASKHGAIYDSCAQGWNFEAAPGTWTPGLDYGAPTCASCHISGAGTTSTSHDVTERLSWEAQAPLTIRPQNFEPFPAGVEWPAARRRMKQVCRQCHSRTWIEGHYRRLDEAVEAYNEIYFKPVEKKLAELYAQGLLDETRLFDERLEWEYYELWHREGRRARMGAAMMALDYVWWRGFYELKKRFMAFMPAADRLLETGRKARVFKDFPNATGARRPKELSGF